ncbi:YtxH domain-containing protein [Bacillus piscicola]|uniref:YtxH domain-containing protein n=1 Tax=Bacillus piscicola TaxID=1632684 RepID=UPI001F08D673|nr:YtxH domain-containing protein [Bacillus piscicola]
MTQQKSKLGSGLLAGLAIGFGIALIDKNTRQMMMDKTRTTKHSVTRLAADVRENPKETKDQLMERVQEASSILREAANDLQALYNRSSGDLSDKLKEIREDSKEVLSSSKEAKEDLQQVSEKVKEAKEELVTGNGSQNDIEDKEHFDTATHDYDRR